MFPLLGMLATALAATPPCSDLDSDNVLQGPHFWITWDSSVADEAGAAEILAWAEEARAVYIEDLDYDFTDRTVLIRVQDSPSSGGLATTTECTHGDVVPVLTLFASGFGQPGENTTKHEVVHAAQYAYMGTYIDAIGSWPWWLEGCAMWMTTHADGNLGEWARRAEDYLDQPWTGLHQTPFAYGDPDLSRFLYGTGWIAMHIADHYGDDAVQATWEYGAAVSGEPIDFRRAIEAAGIDFEDFWHDYMARITVLDSPHADELATGIFIEGHVGALPSTGSPRNPRRPQGLGLSIVHFRRSAGVPGNDLVVEVDGAPEVPWSGVLVRTKGNGPGGKVKETVPIHFDPAGKGVAILEAFDGSQDAWLVVSPQDTTLEPRDYTWTASLDDGTQSGGGEDGCSCGTGTSGLPLMAGLTGFLALVLRRRRT